MTRLIRSVAVSAMAVAAVMAFPSVAPIDLSQAAWAAGDNTPAGAGEPQGNQGGQGAGDKGAQSGQENQGGQGAGQGGPDPTSDSKGPNAGGPADTGSDGGKPIWAQEGIPEVELGRLSVARSPDQVLERALAEADVTLTAEMVDFYNQTLAEIIFDLSVNFDAVSFYDSPLQNLALFQDVLEDGTSVLDGVDTSDPEKLLAVFLGVASDKTLQVTEETATAILTILGEGLDSTIAVDPAELAADAEAVRIAVLAGHG